MIKCKKQNRSNSINSITKSDERFQTNCGVVFKLHTTENRSQWNTQKNVSKINNLNHNKLYCYVIKLSFKVNCNSLQGKIVEGEKEVFFSFSNGNSDNRKWWKAIREKAFTANWQKPHQKWTHENYLNETSMVHAG